MAEIKHDAVGDVDVSGATFTQRSHEVADTFAPNVLEFLGKAGLDAFKRTKMEAAEGEAKSLLEELTGSQRSQQLAKEQSEVFQVEADLATQFSSQEPGSEEQDLTRSQLLGLQEQKEMLDLHQEALVQGLLTEEEFRTKAEASFYTQVALTPGIKDELASVMSEFLGFDPRGQTAKVTLDARKKLSESVDRARRNQIDILSKSELWNNAQSDDANIAQFWPLMQKRMAGVEALRDLNEKLSTEKNIKDAEMGALKQNANGWISDALPLALTEMADFNGVSAYRLTVDEIRAMPDQTRTDWVDSINATAAEFTTPIAELSLRTGDDYKVAFDAMQARQQILLGIVSGADSDEILTARLKRAQNEFNIELEMEKARLVRDQRGILTLAALADVIPVQNMLETHSSSLGFLINGMKGTVDNLENEDPETQKSVLNMYNQTVSQVTAAYLNDPKKVPDDQIATAGRAGNMIANQSVDGVGEEERVRLFKLAGAPGFMERLEVAAPAEAQKMKEGVIKHQTVLGRNWNRVMSNTLVDSPVALNPDDFHLQRVGGEDASWQVMMNTETTNRLIEDTLKAGAELGSSGQSLATRKKFATQRVADLASELQLDFNRTRNLMNSMVAAKSAALSIPETEAAKLVARDLGISRIDIEQAKEPQGFGEENFGKTLDQGTDDDAQPATEGVRESPANKLDDGTYEINGQVFEVKNGEIVEQSGE